MALHRFIVLSAAAHLAVAAIAVGQVDKAGRQTAASTLRVQLVTPPAPSPGARRPLHRAPAIVAVTHAPAKADVVPPPVRARPAHVSRPRMAPKRLAAIAPSPRPRHVARRAAEHATPQPPHRAHSAASTAAPLPQPVHHAAARSVALATRAQQQHSAPPAPRPSAHGAPTPAPAHATPVSRFGAPDGPRLVRLAYPQYPPRARRRGREGQVVLLLRIDARGRLRDATITRSAGDDLDRAALAAVRRSRFGPAQRDGRTVVSSAELTVDFRLH